MMYSDFEMAEIGSGIQPIASTAAAAAAATPASSAPVPLSLQPTVPASTASTCPAAISALGLCSAWSAWQDLNTPAFWGRVGIGAIGIILIGAGAWSAVKQVNQ